MKLLLYLLPLLAVRLIGEPIGQVAGQSPSGKISGQIRDTTGRPVPFVRVFAIPVQADAADIGEAAELLNNITLADKDGRYTLEDVMPGRYRIGAGFVDSPVYYPGVTAVEQGTVVMTAAGQTLANIDFTFTFPGGMSELWGMVGMDDGTPLPAEMLGRTRFIVSSTRRHWGAVPFTRQQGIFFFQGVDREELEFTVPPLPFGYYLKSATYGNVDLTRARLDLTGGLNETQIQVVLTKTRPPGTPAGVRVSGRITGWKPPPRALELGLPLRTVAKVLDGAALVLTIGVVPIRADGSFEIEDARPGQYLLAAPIAVSSWNVTFEVAGIDVDSLDLAVDKASPVPLWSSSSTSIKGNVDMGDASGPANGPVPEFEIQFTPTRPTAAPPLAVKVSVKDFSALVPEGEYLAAISGLPKGYAVVSVTAGPFDLSEPFLVTGKGIADRFTGSPIRNGVITVKLRTVSSEQ